jgi:hypothetical protein
MNVQDQTRRALFDGLIHPKPQRLPAAHVIEIRVGDSHAGEFTRKRGFIRRGETKRQEGQ